MAEVRRLWLGVLVVLAGCGLCSDETMSTDIWVAGERLRVVRRDCEATTGFVYVGRREFVAGAARVVVLSDTQK